MTRELSTFYFGRDLAWEVHTATMVSKPLVPAHLATWKEAQEKVRADLVGFASI